MLTALSIVIWCHLDTLPLEHSSWWRHMTSACLVIIGSGNGSSSVRHQVPNSADTLAIGHKTILAKNYNVYNVYKIVKIKLRHRYFQSGNLIWKCESSFVKRQTYCSGKWSLLHSIPCILITRTLLLICLNFKPGIDKSLHQMWDEIAYSFPNFNGATVKAW